MHPPPNLFGDLPTDLPEELTEILLSTQAFRVERIVSCGHVTAEGFWYDQPTSEWVLLVRGAARLRFEGEEPVALVAGSWVNIPAGKRHRVDWTDPEQLTVWLAIYYS